MVVSQIADMSAPQKVWAVCYLFIMSSALVGLVRQSGLRIHKSWPFLSIAESRWPFSFKAVSSAGVEKGSISQILMILSVAVVATEIIWSSFGIPLLIVYRFFFSLLH